jgi:Protease inhibitor Inh
VGRPAYCKSGLRAFFCGHNSGLYDPRMTVLKNMTLWRRQAMNAAAGLLVLAALAGCAGGNPFGGGQPEPEIAAAPAPPPAPPPPPPPPPVDLGGRWRLTAVGGGACFMHFGNVPGAAQGTIAPEGGCPDKFFTSRKWTFEHNALIIRDHKDAPLAQLSFTNGHFEGQLASGGMQVSLSR